MGQKDLLSALHIDTASAQAKERYHQWQKYNQMLQSRDIHASLSIASQRLVNHAESGVIKADEILNAEKRIITGQKETPFRLTPLTVPFP